MVTGLYRKQKIDLFFNNLVEVFEDMGNPQSENLSTLDMGIVMETSAVDTIETVGRKQFITITSLCWLIVLRSNNFYFLNTQSKNKSSLEWFGKPEK